jgi:hypothetical protein
MFQRLTFLDLVVAAVVAECHLAMTHRRIQTIALMQYQSGQCNSAQYLVEQQQCRHLQYVPVQR